MAILKSLPTSAKINGESVQGNLLKIKSSVIRVDKILKKDFQKEKKDVESTRRRAEKIFRKKLENRVEQKDKLDKVAPEKISVPGLSFLDSFKSFVSKVVLGFFAIKLLPLLGYPYLTPIIEKSISHEKDGSFVFMVESKGVKARAVQTNSELVVLKGSQASKEDAPSWTSGKTMRNRLKGRSRILEHVLNSREMFHSIPQVRHQI